MPSSHSARRADRGVGRRFGPALLLPPLAAFVAGAWFLHTRPNFWGSGGRGADGVPEIADPEEAIEGLAGVLELEPGLELRATLAPLHADPERQAFDAAALARRFDLDPGEPWRLRVRADVARYRAEGLRVVDARGVALVELLPEPAARPVDRPADPLRTLLSAHGAAGARLPRGRATLDVVLWGRRPEAGARLEGLAPAAGAPLAMELEPERLRRADLSGPLARLDADARDAHANRSGNTRGGESSTAIPPASPADDR